MDLHYTLAKSYSTSPELRQTWLDSMASLHLKYGNYSEAAHCCIHIAGLIAEYLRIKGLYKFDLLIQCIHTSQIYAPKWRKEQCVYNSIAMNVMDQEHIAWIYHESLFFFSLFVTPQVGMYISNDYAHGNHNFLLILIYAIVEGRAYKAIFNSVKIIYYILVFRHVPSWLHRIPPYLSKRRERGEQHQGRQRNYCH